MRSLPLVLCMPPHNCRHGRATFSVLLFQDLAVVVLLMLIPLLAPDASGASGGMDKIAKAHHRARMLQQHLLHCATACSHTSMTAASGAAFWCPALVAPHAALLCAAVNAARLSAPPSSALPLLPGARHCGRQGGLVHCWYHCWWAAADSPALQENQPAGQRRDICCHHTARCAWYQFHDTACWCAAATHHATTLAALSPHMDRPDCIGTTDRLPCSPPPILLFHLCPHPVQCMPHGPPLRLQASPWHWVHSLLAS